MKIVIVEDELRSAQNLVKYIEKNFLDTQIAGVFYDGRTALEFLKKHEIDVLFTDICMPNMNGLELISRLRAAWPQLKIVVLSAYDDFEYVRQAFLLGVKDYLLKPIDRIDLAKLLRAKPDRENGEETCNRVVEQVRRLIQEQLAGPITLSSLSEAVSLSPAYLSTLFREETGETLSAYITRLRMENSMRLLSETNLKIYEIAEMCGYADTKYFSYVFKKYTNATPVEYREQRGIKIQ